MTIWFIFALMMGAAIFCVLWPLSRNSFLDKGAAVDDIAFYHQQIVDIDCEIARGLMPASEGEAARAEAARRLLRSSKAQHFRDEQEPVKALHRKRLAAVLALSVLPLMTLSLYGLLGSPALEGQALSARITLNSANDVSLEEAVARIEGHLSRHPDDGRGWEVLAPIYLQTGRFDGAVRAYGEVLRLNGASADRLANLAEALVMADQGIISAQVREALDKALLLDPSHSKALYYRALALEHDGDKDNAIKLLKQLLAAASIDAPWRTAVEMRLSTLQDPAQSEAGRTIASLAPEDRMQAIRGMVAQLASRVDGDDASIEDWMKLIRSHTVLGEKAEALSVLVRAQKKFAGDMQILRRLSDLSKALQLNSAETPVPAHIDGETK